MQECFGSIASLRIYIENNAALFSPMVKDAFERDIVFFIIEEVVVLLGLEKSETLVEKVSQTGQAIVRLVMTFFP